MIEIKITEKEAGTRFDKYLHKILPAAPNSFIYKMLRKKNIVLNESKACGSEKTCAGDVVRLYLSDDTYAKMSRDISGSSFVYPGKVEYKKYIDVLYEDEDVILLNKPAGVLTQKADNKEYSLNEYLIAYLLDCGKITAVELKSVKPSVCNRLDKNTSGIVFCGKTIAGLQYCSELLREHEAAKKYVTIVKGSFPEKTECDNYIKKDSQTNISKVYDKEIPQCKRAVTVFTSIRSGEKASIVECELITGRSHQIRAQLAALGFPCIGDPKYGDKKINAYFKEKAGINYQLLHAFSVEFRGNIITAPIPEYFYKAIETAEI